MDFSAAQFSVARAGWLAAVEISRVKRVILPAEIQKTEAAHRLYLWLCLAPHKPCLYMYVGLANDGVAFFP